MLNRALALLAFTFALDAGAALTLHPGSSPQTQEVGRYFAPVQVNVTDTAGASVPNAQVAWSPLGGISVVNREQYCDVDPLGSCRVTADAQGLAVLPTLYGNATGTYNFDLRSGGATTRLTLTVVPLTNAPTLGVVGVTPSAVAGGQVSPIVVQALDSNGNPIENVNVTFTLSPSIGSWVGYQGPEVGNITNGYGNAGSATIQVTKGLGRMEGHAFMKAPGTEAFISTTFVFYVTAPDGTDFLPLQDMWWSGFNENGWGMSVAQHQDRLFSVIYAYDATGAPKWYVIPDGTWTEGGRFRNYAGAAYAPHGSPYFAYDASRFEVGPAIPGGAILNFRYPELFASDEPTSFLRFGSGPSTALKQIVRQDYSSPRPAPITGLGDMWWGGESQNGWGMAIMEQPGGLFVVWFTYDANGDRTWYVMSEGTWTSPTVYEGPLYRTHSSAWPNYDASQFQVFNVGSFRFNFASTQSAMFTYVADGRAGQMALVRQPF